MRRAVWLLGILACPGWAGELPLRDFFNPATPAFGISLITRTEFDRLSPEQQLWARGVDPSLYFPPPKFEDAIPQAMNRRSRLHAGFSYRERLLEKQRFWRENARDAKLRHMVELVEYVELDDPRRFQQMYHYLTKGLDAEHDRGQPVRALRHSERMFRSWWFDQLGGTISASKRSQSRAAVRQLVAFLRDKRPAVALGAARVLGAVATEEARQATERAVAKMKDSELRTALMRARVRQGGESLRDWIERHVYSDSELTARAGVRALQGESSDWSLELLELRAPTALGRVREDCEVEIARRNGTERANLGRVDFYGTRTRSSRILFCIDVSISMGFPMDGMGGTREPRQRRTIRELTRTLRGLPPSVSFNVMLFSGRRTQLWRRLRPATKENVAEAVAYVAEPALQPGTDIYGAAEAALRSGADTAYLLTDGEPSQGAFLDSALIWEEIAARNEWIGVRFHCVGLSRDQNSELLYQLARRSGGRFLADR